MEQPLVSVIVPVYNMEPFLAETLSSILASTYSHYEIIIVDDGSTDNSVSIAKHYAQQYHCISFYEQKNAGASAARNHGISLAKGQFILPVDSDNIISEHYIEQAANILMHSSDVKVVSCAAVQFGEREGEWKFPKFSYRLLARKNMIDNCAMYRKSDWEKIGGYCETILGREDWDFWISMFKTGGEFVRLPEVGLYYRVRSNSKRRKTQSRKHLLIDAINQRHKPFMYEQLGGPLHYRRSLSRPINYLHQLYKHQSFGCYTNNYTDKEQVYNLDTLWISEPELKPNSLVSNGHYIHTLLPSRYLLPNQEKINSIVNQLKDAKIPFLAPIGYYKEYSLWHIKHQLLLFDNKEQATFTPLADYMKVHTDNTDMNQLALFLKQLQQANMVCTHPELAIAYAQSKSMNGFCIVRCDLCHIIENYQYKKSDIDKFPLTDEQKKQLLTLIQPS